MSINQAVVFTKPVHHLGLDLAPEKLDALARAYFESHGFTLTQRRAVPGPELAAREVIRQHYLIYSTAVYADPLNVSEAGKEKFAVAFGQSWDDEVAAGKILPLAALLATKGIDAHQLFTYWNDLFTARKTAKLQDGVIMAYVPELDAYCVNAFYPSMEANFYHPDTEISYYVMEFDPGRTSWVDFRKTVLGATNASNAVHESLRGQLYSEYPVDYPGRDNFAHGSAGPFEAFVERAVHETDFDMASNPIGAFLAERGLTLESFAEWKAAQSITELGDLFDATEEKDTDEVLGILEAVSWS